MITEITNYKVKDFLIQPEEVIIQYVEVLKNLKPIDTNNNVFHLTLSEVEFIKENIGGDSDEGLLEIIAVIQGYKEIELPNWLKIILPNKVIQYIKETRLRKVLNLKITEFFGLINSVKNQLEVIRKAESSSLVSEHTNVKWETVNGSERLQQFGIYNTLENLAGGDILKYKEIMKLSYSEVFTKLLMNKINSDLQQEMQNIQSTKQN
jgi:hypothetical protein